MKDNLPLEYHQTSRYSRPQMKTLCYIALAFTFVVLDQLSKWAVTEYMIRVPIEKPNPQPLGFFEWLYSAPEKLPFASFEILPFFNIVMVWNKGVSFGMFNDSGETGSLALIALSLLITVVFSIWLFKTQVRSERLAIALIIGGALGNVIDRARFGAVIDFLDFHMLGYHWPAFNVADSCVVIGVFLLIVRSFFFETPAKDAKEDI